MLVRDAVKRVLPKEAPLPGAFRKRDAAAAVGEGAAGPGAEQKP